MPTRAVFASRCATGSNFFPLCLNGAAAAFQGRSDLIGAPFFILWKLCSAQQCRTRAKLFSTEVFMRTQPELARSYLTITRDLTCVMTRLKAIYRSWAIPCAGQQVYAPRHRAEWLAKISEDGVRRRAEF